MIKNLIKEVLLKERISINNLSQLLGMTYANTHQLVNRDDLSDTKLSTLVDIADILNVDITELYQTDSDPEEEKILEYTREELINNVCEKSYRNSQKNHEKIKNCGLEHAKKYDLGNNIWIAFFASHGGITKVFYWGEREITKETALKRADLSKLEVSNESNS